MQADQQNTDPKTVDTASTDATSQEELHQRYVEQMQRMSCPSCGETTHIY